MTDYTDHNGIRFEHASLRGASFTDVYFTGATLRDVDLTGVQVRAALLKDVRMRGVELINVDIYGEVDNVVINGIEIGAIIQAELDRRMPERAAMRARTADEFRQAWAILERLWQETVERARALPAELLHASVDDEWSFIQTVRHLGFASASWVDRAILGQDSPWDPLDLPWDEAPSWEGISWERELRPTLDEALAVRARRQATARGVIESLTEAELDRVVPTITDGWPAIEGFTVRRCLRIVLNEEWEHRLYAERDLTRLERG